MLTKKKTLEQGVKYVQNQLQRQQNHVIDGVINGDTSGVFIVNFEYISHFVLVFLLFLLFTLSR